MFYFINEQSYAIECWTLVEAIMSRMRLAPEALIIHLDVFNNVIISSFLDDNIQAVSVWNRINFKLEIKVQAPFFFVQTPNVDKANASEVAKCVNIRRSVVVLFFFFAQWWKLRLRALMLAYVTCLARLPMRDLVRSELIWTHVEEEVYSAVVAEVLMR